MIDAAERTYLTLDNYGDLLGLAGIDVEGAPCSACGPHATPLRPEALWLGHHAGREQISGASLLCAHHAAEFSDSGHVALAS